MTLRANLRERIEAQTFERRETGRPIGRGDLVYARSEYREVVNAGNAGECMEAAVEIEITKRRAERRDSNRD